MNSKRFNFLTRMAVAVIVTVASGCAELGSQSNLPPEEAVRERAQAWADDLLAGDVKRAWALTTPAYRQYASAERYSASVAGARRWNSATVESVRCEVDVCDVQLMVEYSIKQLNYMSKRALDYKWLLEDGAWWLYVPVK